MASKAWSKKFSRMPKTPEWLSYQITYSIKNPHILERSPILLPLLQILPRLNWSGRVGPLDKTVVSIQSNGHNAIIENEGKTLSFCMRYDPRLEAGIFDISAWKNGQHAFIRCNHVEEVVEWMNEDWGE